jgi:hypothetical protein
MNGRKVVETGSLNVTDVIGLAAFLGFFLAFLDPGIRVIRGRPVAASTIQRFNAAKLTFRVTSYPFPFCIPVNGQK